MGVINQFSDSKLPWRDKSHQECHHEYQRIILILLKIKETEQSVETYHNLLICRLVPLEYLSSRYIWFLNLMPHSTNNEIIKNFNNLIVHGSFIFDLLLFDFHKNSVKLLKCFNFFRFHSSTNVIKRLWQKFSSRKILHPARQVREIINRYQEQKLSQHSSTDSVIGHIMFV